MGRRLCRRRSRSRCRIGRTTSSPVSPSTARRSNYEADTEIARLTDERGTEGTGLFDEEAVVRLRTRVRHTGLFAADFFTVAPNLTLMGAARFNYSDDHAEGPAGNGPRRRPQLLAVEPRGRADVRPAARGYDRIRQLQRVVARAGAIGAELCRSRRIRAGFRMRSWPIRRSSRCRRKRGRAESADVVPGLFVERVDVPDRHGRRHHVHQQRPADEHRPLSERRRHAQTGRWSSARRVLSTRVRWGVAYSFLRARFDTPLT